MRWKQRRKIMREISRSNQFLFHCLLVLTAAVCFSSRGTDDAGENQGSVKEEFMLWKPAAQGTSGGLEGSGGKFRLAPGDQMTVIAKFRRIPGARGNAPIVSAPGWSFGVREDGALFFDIKGRGHRFSLPAEIPKVAPLHVPMTAPWPPEGKAQTGRVTDSAWTTVAWAVNTKGAWWDTFRFYIDGVAQRADQGWAPLHSVNLSEDPVKVGGGTGLELAEVRLYDRHLDGVEIAELAKTGKISPRPSGKGSEPVKKLPDDNKDGRKIFAHRMIGFGPSFAGSSDKNNLASGSGGFLFPVKNPKGPDVPGWCREGHIGALHPPFESQVEEFKWEIGQALEGGIDGFVLNTCGGTHELGIPDNMVKAAKEIGGGFQIGLCLDFAGGTIESKVETVKAWLVRHRDSPALFRLKGLPAFATYGSGYAARLGMPPEKVEREFKQLRDAAGEPIYLIVDLTEFPNLDVKEQEVTARAYAALAEGVTCFYSRQGHERNAAAFAVLARVAHELGKDWLAAPWPNYYTSGRTRNMENIGADNSRYWDRMWRMARETRADYVMLTTWNDINEETTIMPGLRRHFTFLDMLSNYFGPWYRTGVEPKPARDQVYVFYRPYRTDARPPRVAVPRARGSDSQNVIEVRAFLTKPGRVVLEGIGERDAPAGMSSFEFESRPGPVRVRLERERTVLAFQAPEWITDRPWRQDFAIRGFSSAESDHWAKWFPGTEQNYMSEYGDVDGNGLPNWFERYYFGQWNGVDSNADPDNDGKSNLQEYQDGTDPRNPPPIYKTDYCWDAVKDIRMDDETYPIPDSLGVKVWEVEFMSRTGLPAGDGIRRFVPAGLLAPQIPAWLERGNSWSFGIGQPMNGMLLYSGEADSAASQLWTSPIDGRVIVSIEVATDTTGYKFKTPVTVSLTRSAGTEPIWTMNFRPDEDALLQTRELSLSKGDQLRLAVNGEPRSPRWAVRVSWKIKCIERSVGK
jgi:hypothetical protein